MHRSLFYLCHTQSAVAVDRTCCVNGATTSSIVVHQNDKDICQQHTQTPNTDEPIRPEHVERPEPEPRWERT
eukprot:12920565-Prorocentrum_lima.AAC.1